MTRAIIQYKINDDNRTICEIMYRKGTKKLTRLEIFLISLCGFWHVIKYLHKEYE